MTVKVAFSALKLLNCPESMLALHNVLLTIRQMCMYRHAEYKKDTSHVKRRCRMSNIRSYGKHASPHLRESRRSDFYVLMDLVIFFPPQFFSFNHFQDLIQHIFVK